MAIAIIENPSMEDAIANLEGAAEKIVELLKNDFSPILQETTLYYTGDDDNPGYLYCQVELYIQQVSKFLGFIPYKKKVYLLSVKRNIAFIGTEKDYVHLLFVDKKPDVYKDVIVEVLRQIPGIGKIEISHHP